ncbi:putative DNA-binding domain-containing protein [Pseudoalteromonas sp. SMS1]|uniref:HvfC/BufC family peptide modification chaperone n=1 Tax=Pseudoalteromonas sp. SMS1 TaxID=2908894 RepID=UPI001F281794|nr:putative DNA-binding domain-containing protein [Pseudoalteromonas sp. SMS1]MCF2860042.1 putative DNA-binding domain-containing protein [Pseudoalteromonas sp. SMS1]
MTHSTPELEQLQHWLSQVLISRGDLPQKLANAAQRDGLTLEQCIKSTSQLSAQRRIDIYAAGYVMRLVECLKCEFSLLCTFMGSEVFEVFAKAYIVTLPSRSFTLHTLGQSFVRFLTNTRPQGRFDEQQTTMFDVPLELARFERAKAEVLLADGLENIPTTHTAFNEFELLGGCASLSLIAPPCLRLLVSEYDLLPLITQLENGIAHSLPPRETRYIALSRQNYRLVTQPLTQWQADLLVHCNQAISFEQAIIQSAHRQGLDPTQLRSQLAMWLPAAVACGLLVVERLKSPALTMANASY